MSALESTDTSYIAAILDTVGDGVIAIDVTHSIRLVNRETERIFGYDRSELEGASVLLLIPEMYRPLYEAAFDSAIAALAPMPVRYEEVEGLRKGGSTFPLEIRFTRGPIGDDIVLVVAARDITERVYARREIERLREEVTDERDDLRNQVDGLRQEVMTFRRMGQFTLQKKIGEGGMGEVWRASHRMLARPAAVKLVRRDWLDGSSDGVDSTLARFEREAQVTASLKSPHTVSLYDFGVDGKGVLYYVMELLDGFDFETLVTRFGPQPPERVAHLIAQACHSLREAHNVGLIHRDIKPANIVTCRYGADLDFVKVLDFGLVTFQSKWVTNASRLTADGEVPGTPEYMAPELAANPDEVDHRTDLYALGCVAYYLLTGKPVFEAKSPISMLMAHVGKAASPPSLLSPFDISAEFDDLLLSCLQKSPDDRPENAHILRAQLDALTFENPWTPERIEAWWTENQPQDDDDPGGLF